MLLPLVLLLWAREGVRAQGPSLKIQKSVMVQEGLCVHVPCEFTYPDEDLDDWAPAHGYWFRNKDVRSQSGPVATNDPHRPVREETRGRFHLAGDPRAGNCSLDIRDARKTDGGSYVFREERGRTRYSYTNYPLSVQVTGKAGLQERPEGSRGAAGQSWDGPALGGFRAPALGLRGGAGQA